MAVSPPSRGFMPLWREKLGRGRGWCSATHAAGLVMFRLFRAKRGARPDELVYVDAHSLVLFYEHHTGKVAHVSWSQASGAQVRLKGLVFEADLSSARTRVYPFQGRQLFKKLERCLRNDYETLDGSDLLTSATRPTYAWLRGDLSIYGAGPDLSAKLLVRSAGGGELSVDVRLDPDLFLPLYARTVGHATSINVSNAEAFVFFPNATLSAAEPSTRIIVPIVVRAGEPGGDSWNST